MVTKVIEKDNLLYLLGSACSSLLWGFDMTMLTQADRSWTLLLWLSLAFVADPCMRFVLNSSMLDWCL